MTRFRRIAAWAATLFALGTWLPSTASAAPALSCESIGITATVSTFATVGVGPQDWVENLGFDGHGGMWASELELNKLVRYDAHGMAGTSLALASPGATGIEPGGEMFALYGDSDFGSLPGAASGGVVTFDPTAAKPVATPFASGISMANGAALDAAGNLYVADSLKAGLLKYSPSGALDTTFEKDTQISTADGVAIAGNTLYATEIFSPNATIVKVPLNNPSAHSVLTTLLPLLGPDDLTVGPDGALYVATASGQLVRVDPSTGSACVVVDTGFPATSVRFPVDFAPYRADAGDAFVSSELGVILHVHMTGLKPLQTQPTTPVAPSSQPAAPTSSATVNPRRIRRATPTTVTIRVRATPATCADAAHVRLGRFTADTGSHGRARLRVHFSRTGRYPFTVHKRGCPTGRGALAVTG